MQKTDTSLGIFEISSPSLGYRLLDGVLKSSKVEVIEASMLSPTKFLMILSGREEELRAAEASITEATKGPMTEDLVDKQIVTGVNERLLPALYSLTQQPILNCLLFIEMESVSGALALVNHLLQKDEIRVIDIKISRGSGSHTLAVLTGQANACTNGEQDALALLTKTGRSGRVELIVDPAAGLRRLFSAES